MTDQQLPPPQAPQFLVDAKNAAAIVIKRGVELGRPVNEYTEEAINAFIEKIFEAGFGFSHNDMAKRFLQQAQVVASMLEMLAMIRKTIEQEGSYSETGPIDEVMVAASVAVARN